MIRSDKIVQSKDSVETFAYGTNKEVIHRKEEIKCHGIIKQYEKWLTMMMLQMRHSKHNLN